MEEKIKDLERKVKHYEDKEYKDKNYLQIGGYGGIHVPLDASVKKEIREYIEKMIRDMLAEDTDLEKTFVSAALNYKNAFKNIFTPIVKEMIEDLDFNVRFNAEE